MHGVGIPLFHYSMPYDRLSSRKVSLREQTVRLTNSKEQSFGNKLWITELLDIDRTKQQIPEYPHRRLRVESHDKDYQLQGH